MSEQYARTNDYPELGIVPDPQVAWQAHAEMPTSKIDEAWEWISRLGLVGDEVAGGENAAGWGLPDSRWVPKTLRSPATLEGTRVLEAGMKVRDALEGSYAEVIEIDHDRKTVLFKSDWPPKSPGEPPMLYTYRITLEPGWRGDNAIITTDMRATNVRHPRLMQRFGPSLDQKAMEVFARGLARRVDPEQAGIADKAKARKHLGYAAAIGVGVAGWKLARHRN